MAGKGLGVGAVKKVTLSRRKVRQRKTPAGKSRAPNFAKVAQELAVIGRGFYSRGWVLGTSGNFSAVVSREPLRLAITSTGLDKGNLTSAHFLEMAPDSKIIPANVKPSSDALLHLP